MEYNTNDLAYRSKIGHIYWDGYDKTPGDFVYCEYCYLGDALFGKICKNCRGSNRNPIPLSEVY